MKIAYLTGEYPRATDTFIQREVAALRKLGFEVLTCTVRRTGIEHLVGEEQKREQARSFHVLETAKRPHLLIKAHAGLFRSSPKRWLASLALAWQTAPKGLIGRAFNLFYFAEAGVLAYRLKRDGIEHLHNHIAKSSCTVAMLASALSSIPFSFTLHGPDIFFEPLRWRLDEKIARARFVACISHFCRSQAMAFSAPEHWHKLQIIHCGVEPERYANALPPTDKKQLLFVGRLAHVKGLPVLLEALAQLGDSDAALDIVGDGPDRAALERQASELGLSEQVNFLGYQSQSEVAERLKKCDVFVLPSFAEGVPVVLMEAMAARRPVIATRIAGIPELVEHRKSGLLCPPGDADALADAIGEVFASPSTGCAMGEEGRRTVLKSFVAAHEASKLADLFKESADISPEKGTQKS